MTHPTTMVAGEEATALGQRAASRAAGKYGLLGVSVLVGLLAAINLLDDGRASAEWPYLVAGTFLIWSGAYLLCTLSFFRSIYMFASAYILCLAVFHFGHVFVFVSGLQELTYLVRSEMAFWYKQAAWYCMLAFACLGAGMAAGMRVTPAAVSAHGVSEDDSARQASDTLRYAYWVGFGLLVAGIVGLFLTIGSVGNLLRFSRAEIFAGVGDTRGFGFFLLVAPSAVVLMVATARSSAQKLVSYTIGAVLAVSILFLGYRSSVLFPGLCAAILWVKLGRRIPVLIAALTLVAVIILIPSVRYLRALGAYEELTASDVQASLQQGGDAPSVLLELGGVSTVVAYVVKTVPDEWDYRFGQSYWLALRTSIPNLGLSMESSGREAFLSRGVADREALSRMHPADWYTYIVDRWMFDRGGGAGFSTIAEAYLNFGGAGIVMYFLGLGFFLGRLDQVDLLSSPRLLVFSGAMIWPLLKTVRNTFGTFLKPVAFIVVCIVIWRLATFWMERRRS